MVNRLEENVSDGVLYKIADDTVAQIIGMDSRARPKHIYLNNSHPTYLTKIMLRMYEQFEKRKVKGISVFIGEDSGYAVDVGRLIPTCQPIF